MLALAQQIAELDPPSAAQERRNKGCCDVASPSRA
jgi:hypothetical protein